MASALRRRESRGGHYCVDFPEAQDAYAHATIISSPVKRRPADLAKPSGRGGAAPFGTVLGAKAKPTSPRESLLLTRSNPTEE